MWSSDFHTDQQASHAGQTVLIRWEIPTGMYFEGVVRIQLGRAAAGLRGFNQAGLDSEISTARRNAETAKISG